MIYKIKDTEKVKKLFQSWDETMIWSCLQNVMGTIYADSIDSPASAMAHMGDFCFLVSEANEELLQYWNQKQREFIITSWDAANLWSVGLAEKLGYHFDYEYKIYEIVF